MAIHKDLPLSEALQDIRKAIEDTTANNVNKNILELTDIITSEKGEKGEHEYHTRRKQEHGLEQIIVRLLKSELHAWLNQNLSYIVKDVVKEEINKLINKDNN